MCLNVNHAIMGGQVLPFGGQLCANNTVTTKVSKVADQCILTLMPLLDNQRNIRFCTINVTLIYQRPEIVT